ncbi:MAG: PKD domain-containing protein [Methanoregula sp.]|jgi:PKD repeat protein|nr:PKD domain-containing protein [Methanoregula sp.]
MKRLLCILLCLLLLVGVVSADEVVVYALSTNADGAVFRGSVYEPYATIYAGSGTGSDITSTGPYLVRLLATTTNQSYSANYRYIWSGNTTLPAGSTINSVVFRGYLASTASGVGNLSFGITGCTPANPAALAASDYNTYGSTFYSNYYYLSTIATGLQNLTLTDFSGINTTGTTSLMVRFPSSPGETWFSAQESHLFMRDTSYAGTDYDPRLIIDYTPGSPPDTTPPASITNLANTTTCNSINWTWQDPTDPDFDAVQIYWNGVLNSTAGKGIGPEGIIWNGLEEFTEYTFSAVTYDNASPPNYNWSFVNMTAKTDACGVAPVADFSADNTSVCIDQNVTFTDLSSNTPTSWHWVVSGGWDSHEQNPIHAFDAEGLYDVVLTATNDAGSDEETKLDYINVTDCAIPPTPTPTTTSPTPTPTPTIIPTITPIGNYANTFFENESVRINQSLTHDPMQGKATPWILWILSGYIGLAFILLALCKPRSYRMDYEINIILSVLAWPFLWYWTWGALTSIDYIVGVSMAGVGSTSVMITQHILYSFPILGWIGVGGCVAAIFITTLLVGQFRLFNENEENQRSESI